MSQPSEAGSVSHQTYERPPVTEVLLGVQFKPMMDFKSLHYGLFWANHLSDLGWVPVADEGILPRVAEAFDKPLLKANQKKGEESAVGVRIRMKNGAEDRMLQFQPDKLLLSWVKNEAAGGKPPYDQLKNEFSVLFQALTDFIDDHEMNALQPDLWEVKYLNQIPPGQLWNEPSDWPKILPSLFPPDLAMGDGLRFATFEGEWYYEIEPQKGRVKVRAAKMFVNQKPPAVLYLRVQARGDIGESGMPDWSSGFDLGHGACNRLFNKLTSPDAQKEWGVSHAI